jgi:hypothetical protein
MKYLLDRYKYPPIYIELNSWALFLQGESPSTLLDEVCECGYSAYEIIDGSTICEYPKTTFPMCFTTDVVLFKEKPAHLTVLPPPIPSEKTITQILSKLRVRKDWMIHDNYILYSLKDFPEYYLEPNINSELTKIVTSENNTIINKALDWFRCS